MNNVFATPPIMDRKIFTEIITQHICPILTGSKIGIEISSKPSSDLVTIQKGGQTLHIKPAKKSDYKIEVTRPQIFSGNDKRIIQSIITEIIQNYGKVDENYNERIINYAVEIGICKYISPKNFEILFDILDGFDKWATRTYEGRRVTFSVFVDFANNQPSNETYPSIKNILEEDFCALLSNSVDTCLEVSSVGALISYLNLSNDNANVSFSPERFHAFANHSSEDKICLTLTNNGDILIFQNKELIFSKRRAIWNYFNHEPVLKRIAGSSKYTNENARRAIYETILDVSFSRTGGCIAFVRRTDISEIQEKKVVKEDDLIDLAKSIKSQSIKRLIGGNKFQDLDRVLRKELLGIDGATVIDFEGNIIAVGAIIQIKAGSTGGGRLAATKTLSHYGTAIKISSDGMVKGYKSSTHKQEELFSFG